MEHIIKAYDEAFKRYGDSPQGVLWPKGRQEERFHALTRHIPAGRSFSVLDYGCGLAHLKQYLDKRHVGLKYTGVDSLPAFVEAGRKKHPDAIFENIRSPEVIMKDYDYVVISGVFNIQHCPDKSSNRDFVFHVLRTLFARTRNYLAVDFMTDEVDFQQEGSYHQNVNELCEFVRAELSPRFIVDQSYMPYEYALTVWKNHKIVRPDNMYEQD